MSAWRGWGGGVEKSPNFGWRMAYCYCNEVNMSSFESHRRGQRPETSAWDVRIDTTYILSIHNTPIQKKKPKHQNQMFDVSKIN